VLGPAGVWHDATMRLLRLCLLVALLIAALLVPPGSAATRPEVARPAPDRSAAATCKALTLRQRVAQVVTTGLPSTQATAVARRLVRRHAGAVVLLGHNVEGRWQVRRLTRRLRAAAPARLLVAVDEEGGRVARLGNAGLVTRVPSARWVAAHDSVAKIRRRGARLGREMLELGVNWNFAPVLDVAAAPSGTVIGDRSYSSDPDVVSAYGRAYARGLQSAGVRTTGKHFPGHGRTTVDSHETLPTVNASLRRLRRTDLQPFVAAGPDLDAVMTAHVRYPKLGVQRPGSLSPRIRRLLRADLGYEGLIVTDALEMGAVTSRYRVPRAAELAIVAGADVALVGDWRRTPAVADRLVAAVNAGRLSHRRLKTAAGRVLAAKRYRPAMIDCLLR
jgi:beta-N-acetylhexosaminidase